MKQKLIERLSTFLNKHKMRGTPATDEQIEQAEKVLNVKFSSDYIDFIKHFGRAWADIEIFAFEGNETVVGYTQSLREFMRKLQKTMLLQMMEQEIQL